MHIIITGHKPIKDDDGNIQHQNLARTLDPATRERVVNRLKREARGYAQLAAAEAEDGLLSQAAGNITKATLHGLAAAKYFDAAKRSLDLAKSYKDKTENQPKPKK